MSGRTGSVTFVQRFGSAANLNLHAHVLVLDGVFAPAADRRLVFHPASPPEPQTLHELLSRVRARIARYLERTGAGELEPADGNDPVADQAPTLASCYAASLMGRRAFGARAGAKLQSVGGDPRAPWKKLVGRHHVALDGFDLHGALTVPAHRADGRRSLEHLVRYCARPPLSERALAHLG